MPSVCLAKSTLSTHYELGLKRPKQIKRPFFSRPPDLAVAFTPSRHTTVYPLPQPHHHLNEGIRRSLKTPQVTVATKMTPLMLSLVCHTEKRNTILDAATHHRQLMQVSKIYWKTLIYCRCKYFYIYLYMCVNIKKQRHLQQLSPWYPFTIQWPAMKHTHTFVEMSASPLYY